MEEKKNLDAQKGILSGIDAIRVIGAFDKVDKQIDVFVDEIIEDGKKDIVFDFSQTSYLTSSGIAVLTKALRKVQKAGGTLYVSNITEDMYELLSCTSLNSFIKYI